MGANGKDSIFYDFKSMKLSVAAKTDIMLVLGVSGCIFLPYIRRIFKGKIITNIDGLEWRRDKWKWYAKKLLKLSEKMAVKYSDIVICDNKGITDYIKSEYSKIIENKKVELIVRMAVTKFRAFRTILCLKNIRFAASLMRLQFAGLSLKITFM